MHSPKKLGTARLSRWAWGGNPTITKTSGPCQSVLSSVIRPAVLLARIFWFFAFLFHQAGGDLFSVLPQGKASILAGLREFCSGRAEGMHKAQAGSLQSWIPPGPAGKATPGPASTRTAQGQRSSTYTWEEDSFTWSLHSKIKKIPDINLFPFIYK